MSRAPVIFVTVLAMSLAWPLRGQFGHLRGAAIPGAFVAVAVSLLMPGAAWRRAFGTSVLFGGVGFALGGHLGYARLIQSVVAAPTLGYAAAGLGMLFLTGAAWGGVGMTLLAYGACERPWARRDAWLFAALATVGLGDSPPCFFAALGLLHLYNAVTFRSELVALFGFAGTMGFGAAFAVAVAVLAAGSHGWFGVGESWWALRDQIIGTLGGVGVGWAVWEAARRRIQPDPSAIPTWSMPVGLLALVIGIPALNAVNVFQFWAAERPVFPPTTLAGLAVAVIVFLVGLGAVWRRLGHGVLTDSRRDLLIRGAAICGLWVIIALAIAKEMVPLGWHRWERTFTLFLVEGLVLTWAWLARWPWALRPQV